MDILVSVYVQKHIKKVYISLRNGQFSLIVSLPGSPLYFDTQVDYVAKAADLVMTTDSCIRWKEMGSSLNNASLFKALSMVMLRIDMSKPYSLRDSATFSARYSPVCDFVNLDKYVNKQELMYIKTTYL